MKLWIRIVLTVLCISLIVSMIAVMPFTLSSPEMLMSEKTRLSDQNDGDSEDGDDIDFEDDETIDFGRLFFSSAYAEGDDLIVETVAEGELHIDPEWKLPFDLSAGPRPNPDKYTENGYEDQSIRVTTETRTVNGDNVFVTYVQIADASQLRTAVAYKITENRVATLKKIAQSNNAVAAMNGDLYIELPEKKSYEVRMTEKIRNKTNKQKDILIIDNLGNFHLFIRSYGLRKDDKPYFGDQVKEEGLTVVNALTFGPALVKDGEIIDQTQNEKEYSYNPGRKNPRSAIGQTGPLSYVMVIVEATDRDGKTGATMQELAQIMYDLGCIQAYNLDGGNTAEMIIPGPADEKGEPTTLFYFAGQRGSSERGQKDIIYFATAVPESEWE